MISVEVVSHPSAHQYAKKLQNRTHAHSPFLTGFRDRGEKPSQDGAWLLKAAATCHLPSLFQKLQQMKVCECCCPIEIEK